MLNVWYAFIYVKKPQQTKFQTIKRATLDITAEKLFVWRPILEDLFSALPQSS